MVGLDWKHFRHLYGMTSQELGLIEMEIIAFHQKRSKNDDVWREDSTSCSSEDVVSDISAVSVNKPSILVPFRCRFRGWTFLVRTYWGWRQLETPFFLFILLDIFFSHLDRESCLFEDSLICGFWHLCSSYYFHHYIRHLKSLLPKAVLLLYSSPVTISTALL